MKSFNKTNPTIWLGIGVILLFIGNYVVLNQIFSIMGTICFVIGAWLFYKQIKKK